MWLLYLLFCFSLDRPILVCDPSESDWRQLFSDKQVLQTNQEEGPFAKLDALLGRPLMCVCVLWFARSIWGQSVFLTLGCDREQCIVHHAPCTMFQASCTMHHASCIIRFAFSFTHYALCIMHFALCIMRYVMMIMHHASCIAHRATRIMHNGFVMFQCTTYHT